MFSYVDLANVNLVRVFTVVADLAIVSFIMYKIISFFKDTQAVSIIKGLAVLFAAYLVAEYLKLDAVFWLLRQVTTMALIGIPIVFQPELRRALERLGRGNILGSSMRTLGVEERRAVLGCLIRAVEAMSREFTGALIVLERETGLGEIIDNGVRLDARVSTELLMNLFTPNTPLHDGAVVIRGNRIVAAACVLPLSERQAQGRKLGTRHRAALGITERTDAVAVVVSEETGNMSIGVDGVLERNLSPERLSARLIELFDLNHKPSKFRIGRGGRAHE